MQKRNVIIVLFMVFFLVSISQVFALQASYSGTVAGLTDESVVVARVNDQNSFAEVIGGSFSELVVEGNPGDEVEFFVLNKLVKRTTLSEGEQTIALDASVSLPPEISTPPETVQEKPIERELPKPVQKRIVAKKTTTIWSYVLFAFLILALAVGAFFFLRSHQEKFENTPEKKLEPKLPEIGINVLRRPPFIPPKISTRQATLEGPKIVAPPILEMTASLPKEPTPLPTVQEEALKTYVKSMKEKGFNESQIKAALYARGWKKEIIDKLFGV